MAERMACAPFLTITHRQCNICRMVSMILQLMGLSSATRHAKGFDLWSVERDAAGDADVVACNELLRSGLFKGEAIVCF